MISSRSLSTTVSFLSTLKQSEKAAFALAALALLLGSILDSSALLIVLFVARLLSQDYSADSLTSNLISSLDDYSNNHILSAALLLMLLSFALSSLITLRVNLFSSSLVSRLASRKFNKYLSSPYCEMITREQIEIRNMFTQTTYRIMAEVVNPLLRILSSSSNIAIVSIILYIDNDAMFLVVLGTLSLYILIISALVKYQTRKLGKRKQMAVNQVLKYSSFTPSMATDISLYPRCRDQISASYNESLSTYLKIDQVEALTAILPRNTLEFIIAIVALVLCFNLTEKSDYSTVILYGLAFQKLIPSIQKLQVAHMKLSLNKDIFKSFFLL